MLILPGNRAAYRFEAFLYPFVFPNKKLRLCALSEHPLSAFSAGPRRAARYTVYKSILVRALQHHQEALVDVPPPGNQSLLIRWRRDSGGERRHKPFGHPTGRTCHPCKSLPLTSRWRRHHSLAGRSHKFGRDWGCAWCDMT